METLLFELTNSVLPNEATEGPLKNNGLTALNVLKILQNDFPSNYFLAFMLVLSLLEMGGEEGNS